jgi:hypothetical protein
MSYSHANFPPSLPPSHQPTTYPRRLPMAASTRIPQPTPLLPHRRRRTRARPTSRKPHIHDHFPVNIYVLVIEV